MDTITAKEIGRAVSAYFKQNHITQQEAADRLGASSKQIIANQLNGRKFGKITAKKYAEQFGFNEDFLLFGTGELLDNRAKKSDREAELLQIIRSQQETIRNLSMPPVDA